MTRAWLTSPRLANGVGRIFDSYDNRFALKATRYHIHTPQGVESCAHCHEVNDNHQTTRDTLTGVSYKRRWLYQFWVESPQGKRFDPDHFCSRRCRSLYYGLQDYDGESPSGRV